jgi:hypothetical protein
MTDAHMTHVAYWRLQAEGARIRCEQLERENALLREAEQAARTVQEKHKREHISGETCVCPVCIALATVDTFRRAKT